MSPSWKCPFCGQHATITENDMHAWSSSFELSKKYGRQRVQCHVVRCPNKDCDEFTLTAAIYNATAGGAWDRPASARKFWQLIPASAAKILPEYVPQAIRADYEEACLIRDLSPKASATLSRRCLQGMIRDFWNVRKRSLKQEVDALQEHVDATTWAAIDSVRAIGNIGAHMEKDIDHIVDVVPQEAALLISLVETLIDEWYVARHDREQRMQSVIAASQLKANQRSTRPTGVDSGGIEGLTSDAEPSSD